MKNFIKEFNKPIIYGFVVFIAFIALNQVLYDYGSRSFVLLSIIFTVIYLFLLYADHLTHLKKFNQAELFQIDRNYYFRHIINHYLIPLVLFISTIIFILLNTNTAIKLCIIFISSVSITICLINLRSYFLNKLIIESKTHAIYDGMKILIFFLLTNTILHIQVNLNLNNVVIVLMLFLITLIGISLMFIRRDIFHKEMFLISLAGSSIISLVYILCSRVVGLTLLETNIVLLCFFYFLTALIHHRIERTLTKQILINYLLFISMTILIIYGMH